MIWNNPFMIRSNEQQDNESEFLLLFDSSVLQMIEEKHLRKVNFFTSSPGAGKSSLFHAFSPKVLSAINDENGRNNPNNKEIIGQMKRLKALDGNRVTLISSMLSCARGYNIIDEMFENGRRKQVLFALLNYRIVIVFLRNIYSLTNTGNKTLEECLRKVNFKKLPDEMLNDEAFFQNGYTAYQWACDGERKLCNYLDNGRKGGLELSFVHTTLLTVKLFESENILIEGEKYFNHSILIFDDFHKLSANQRDAVSNALYTLRANMGIWIGQRLEGLTYSEIVSPDGNWGREYEQIIIDRYWADNAKKFVSILENISNKRVKEANFNHFNGFAECLDDGMYSESFKRKLALCITDIKNRMSVEDYYKYSDVIAHIDKTYAEDIFSRAKYYECIQMKINRDKFGQLKFFFLEKVDINSMEEFYKTNNEAAGYYISIKYEIPFYFGIVKLLNLSSYNIEQFLYFAAEIFERCRAKSLGKRRRGTRLNLLPDEQEQCIKKCAEKKWNDIRYRYTDFIEIQYFLSKIAENGVRCREEERGSYPGGAYTGFCIDSKELDRCKSDKEYKHTFKILGECISAKYLEKREQVDGTVFYLNRWLCVFFKLPLAYGGWFKSSLAKIKSNYITNYSS